MIKIKGFNERLEHWFVGFGLSKKNFELLKQGLPIFVEGKRLGANTDFFIFCGDTEDDTHKMLKEYVDDDTKIDLWS